MTNSIIKPVIQPLTPADTQSANVVEGNLAQLKTLFPEAFKEGGVDFEVLKQLLGGQVDEREEKYGLNWHGKRRARQIALTPSTGTLRPCPGESVDWDTTQNLMIEGDNLEVLKLLQKSYAGKVKMIYIDPPYNTGKDFVYPDNFTDNIKNYLELTGQTDGEGRKLSSNTEASGRFHTDWLNMMYPRLKLARNLLREDGVIFITLDDTEVANMRKIADDIFGEENFVANVVWQKKYAVANDDPGIGVMHDHVLVYRKSELFIRGLLQRTDEQNARYTNPDNDPKGEWASDNYVSNKSKEERPTLWYPIKHPLTNEDVWPDTHAVWRYSLEKHLEIERQNGLYWGPNVSYKKPRLKRYLNEVQQGIVPPTWWTFDDCGHNDEAQKETASLVGQKVFTTPKPLRLIRRMITIGALDKNAIVMDFFAGSASTGHAVMEQNVEDFGNRRYVLVQLPEPLVFEANEQRTSAEFCDSIGKPRNIAELTKERLRRAATKIAAARAHKDSATAQLSLENEAKKPEKPLDLGFKVFKLDTSNIRAWNPNPDELADTLMAHTEHLAAGRTEADVLYEVLLKQGLDLATPITRRVIAGHTVHSVGAGALLVCLARAVDEAADVHSADAESIKAMSESTVTAANAEALALGMANWHTELAAALGQTPAELHTRVVLRDSLFGPAHEADVAKTNLTAILRQRGLEDVRSL